MVSISAYGKRKMRNAHLDTGTGLAALSQGLSFGLPMVLKYLRAEDHEFSQYTLPLLPCESGVVQVLYEFLNLKDSERGGLAPIHEKQSVLDKTKVSVYLDRLQKKCQCSRCTGDISSLKSCLKDSFKRSFVGIATDILALSLFDCTEPIRVCLNPSLEYPESNGFMEAVEQILFGSTEAVTKCSVFEPMDWALFMIDHPHNFLWAGRSGESTWVASTAHGQVVFPAFLDELAFDGRCLTRLSGGPGSLRHQRLCYNMVVDSGHQDRDSKSFIRKYDKPVDGPRNLDPDRQLTWMVQIDEDCLDISMGSTGFESMSTHELSPMKHFERASKALFIPSCAHGKDMKIDPPDDQSVYATWFYQKDNRPGEELDERTAIVAVAGDAKLRFAALAGADKAVIRGGACLKCCIKICRLADFDYVIS